MCVTEDFPKASFDSKGIRGINDHVAAAERRKFRKWSDVNTDTMALVICIAWYVLWLYAETFRMELPKNSGGKLLF